MYINSVASILQLFRNFDKKNDLFESCEYFVILNPIVVVGKLHITLYCLLNLLYMKTSNCYHDQFYSGA